MLEPTTAELDTMLDISEAAARAMLAQGGSEDRALQFGADQALAWFRAQVG